MAIEIVDFPSYKLVIVHSYVNVYGRVENPQKNIKESCSRYKTSDILDDNWMTISLSANLS